MAKVRELHIKALKEKQEEEMVKASKLYTEIIEMLNETKELLKEVKDLQTEQKQHLSIPMLTEGGIDVENTVLGKDKE